jgi:hypothetical protein
LSIFSCSAFRVLRDAKYIAALAMTTSASDKPLNDARHAVVTTLSDLVKALEADPTPEQEKIDKAKGAIRTLVSALKGGPPRAHENPPIADSMVFPSSEEIIIPVTLAD